MLRMISLLVNFVAHPGWQSVLNLECPPIEDCVDFHLITYDSFHYILFSCFSFFWQNRENRKFPFPSDVGTQHFNRSLNITGPRQWGWNILKCVKVWRSSLIGQRFLNCTCPPPRHWCIMICDDVGALFMSSEVYKCLKRLGHEPLGTVHRMPVLCPCTPCQIGVEDPTLSCNCYILTSAIFSSWKLVEGCWRE